MKDLSEDPGRTAEIAKAGFDYARRHHGERKLTHDFLDNLAAARSIQRRYRHCNIGAHRSRPNGRPGSVNAGNAGGVAVSAKRGRYTFRAIVPSHRNPI